MYTITMRDDKSLRATKKSTIYQRESLVDKVQILIPLKYEELDLTDFTAVLKYKDQKNVAHVEVLKKEESLYTEYSKYVFPVDTNLTQFAGDITIRITLSKTDLQNKKQYVLHTGEIIISILPLEDYYAFVTDESLEHIDQIIGNLDAKIEAVHKIAEIYDISKADNIVKHDDGKIQLTSKGVPIGDTVTIPENVDVGEVEVIEF